MAGTVIMSTVDNSDRFHELLDGGRIVVVKMGGDTDWAGPLTDYLMCVDGDLQFSNVCWSLRSDPDRWLITMEFSPYSLQLAKMGVFKRVSFVDMLRKLEPYY